MVHNSVVICDNSHGPFSLAINLHMVKDFLYKVRFPMILEFNSLTISLTSCRKKYFPGLQMCSVEVNSPAWTEKFLIIFHLFRHSVLKVRNSNFSNGCAVDVQFYWNLLSSVRDKCSASKSSADSRWMLQESVQIVRILLFSRCSIMYVSKEYFTNIWAVIHPFPRGTVWYPLNIIKYLRSRIVPVRILKYG